ncbi:MAG: hypothetical protein KC464_33875, partial [Myxococcales bacterium]|nr:hypothetical protein [Myxococcales bacterium]
PRGAIGGGDDAASRGDAATAASGLAFVAPTSGRYYARPGPDKAPFVSVGDVLRDGHTVCLLEVMKTFNRVVYDAAELGLPAAARVVAIEVGNEQDVDAGTVILRLEEAT